MHRLTFYPLGNADCCLIDLAGGQKILFDYADMRNEEEPEDLRIPLGEELRRNLKEANRAYFDVVAFTHLDNDHICKSSEFFHLEHAQAYQGEGRIKINQLWVPAAAVIEEGCSDEDRIIRAEARHRLKNGKGIRVFSRPAKLKEWLESEGLGLESRQHLITDAGQIVPEFTLGLQGVELFVHSPFAFRLNEAEVIDRNVDSLVVQATFSVDGTLTRFLLGSDLEYQAISDVVKITRAKKRDERLESDITKLWHHCSYTAIGPEKGQEKTEPVEEVKWIFEEKLPQNAIIVSTSKPIPSDDEDVQPPHRQAAAYYKDCIAAVGGEFKVTMEHPNQLKPEPLIIEIDGSKGRIKKRYVSGVTAAVTSRAPRAGN
jgi:hypothetical protein